MDRPGILGAIRTVMAAAALVAAVAVTARDTAAGSGGPTAVLAAAASLPLLVAAIRPRLASTPWLAAPGLLVVFASVVTLEVRRPDDGAVAPILLLALSCVVGAAAPLRYSLPAGLAAVAAPQVLDFAVDAHTPVAMAVGTACAWFAGVGLGSQERLLDELRAAHAEIAARAAADERQRLIGELHDQVAHTLAVTMLYLTGARLSLGEGDVGEALESLSDAESMGRQAMREMRRSADLGAPAQGQQVVPALPRANDLRALLEQYVEAGLHVALETDGDLNSLPDDTGLGLYRIVQESLANAARHAPAETVRVDVMVAGGEVRVSVRNQCRGATTAPGAGLGIAGMVRRAALLGGTLTAGPGAGDWRVEAVLPLASA